MLLRAWRARCTKRASLLAQYGNGCLPRIGVLVGRLDILKELVECGGEWLWVAYANTGAKRRDQLLTPIVDSGDVALPGLDRHRIGHRLDQRLAVECRAGRILCGGIARPRDWPAVRLAPARLAHNQPCGHSHRHNVSAATGNIVEQQFHGAIAQLEGWMSDGSQRRRLPLGVQHVVETNHRDILRNAQRGIRERAQHANGGLVVTCQHSSEIDTSLEHMPHRMVRLVGAMLAVTDQCAIERQTVRRHGRPIGGQPLGAITARMLEGGDISDSAMAMSNQMGKGLFNPGAVGGANRWIAGLRIGKNDWMPVSQQFLNLRLLGIGKRRNRNQPRRVPWTDWNEVGVRAIDRPGWQPFKWFGIGTNAAG